MKSIAQKVAKIHHCEVDLDQSPSLFGTLDRWASNARNVRIRSDDPAQQKIMKALDINLMVREIKDLQRRLESLNSPIVFCHNDLNAGNMLVDGKGNISIIDYEYGSYNYRGFDLGNFFCEWIMNYKVKEPPKFKVGIIFPI